MKIVLVISWYDESPSWLSTVVTGFGRFCDEVVAVDGAYLFYPEARGRSHPEQAEAILLAAEAAGIGCTIHRPRGPFVGNEVEKRNLTLALAGALDPDWLVIADGDYHVIECDPDAVRGALEQTELNVATYLLADGMDAHAGANGSAKAVEIQTSWRLPTRDIFRWTPDLQYGPAHWTISGTYDCRLRWLKGPELNPQVFGERLEDCLDLRDSLVAVHRSKHRAKLRREASETYYRRRDEAAVETLTGFDWSTRAATI